MKKILLTLTTVFTAIISFAQIQSNCNVPSILYTEYDEAVTDLAIRRMYQVNSPDTVYITVPQTQKDTIWEGLAAIFNAPSLIGWDSVFNKFCVKQTWFNVYFNRNANVRLDTNYAWTHNWLNEELITGYTELDNFISNNEFIYVSKNTYPSNGITLQTESSKYMNYKAFCDSLINFDGIITAYSPQIVLLDGNIITYNKINDTKYYDFNIRYGGDCQAGCVNSHIWKYKVNQNCSVEFLGIEETINDSEPFPAPTNCNIATTIVNTKENNLELSIYPNPAKNTLFLEIKNSELKINNYNKNTSVFIYDVYGRVVKQSVIARRNNVTIPSDKQITTSQAPRNDVLIINISTLQKAVYFVKVDNSVAKFIKE